MRILWWLWLKTQFPTALTTNSSHVGSSSSTQAGAACPDCLSGSDLQQCLVCPHLPLTVQCPLLLKKLESDSEPLPHTQTSCHLPPRATQSQLSVGSEAPGVVPGAARLVSETAQKVHAIGQNRKNEQHLLRVQALLSGRKAKGLTSGRPRTLPLRSSVAP